MQEIIDIVRMVLPQAGRDYQSMSLGYLCDMPERWVQCKLGEALHANGRCRVRLEVPVDDIGLRKLDGLRNGKVDIAAYSDAKRECPSFVIEVKCKRSSWGSVTADAVRLREILIRNEAIEFGLMAYVSGEMAHEECDGDRRRMRKYAAVTTDDEIVEGSYECDKDNDLSWFCQILLFRRAKSRDTPELATPA